MEYPGGHPFAFTLLDDTDDSTVERVAPVYDLLAELGFRTTKTVWCLDCPEGSRKFFAAETLQSPRYLALVRELLGQGFELAWHSATMESSPRSRVLEALGFFQREFGFLPQVHSNHGQNRENLYWGARRYQSWLAGGLMRAGAHLRGEPRFEGDRPDSPWFWGDLCRQHFRFVRNFTFPDLDLLSRDPYMPYRLASTPWVQYWFSTSDAPHARAFKRLLTRERIDRLARDGGLCILSTHLGKGYARDGRVDPQVAEILRYLASLGGWFAPVSELLEHLLVQRAGDGRPRRDVAALEWSHILQSLRGSPA